MKKNILIFAAAAALSLAACGGAKTETKAESAASAAETKAAETVSTTETVGEKELQKLDIVLDWYPNAIHTFLYEAQENGYFAEEGIELNILSPADSVDSITFVAAGRAQLGLTYPIDVITAYKAQNMPVVCIGAVAQDALSCMCALKETEIGPNLENMKGKKIGYSGTGAGAAEIDTIMASAGLEKGDYELINVGFDLVSSLTTGSVDFVEGTFINDEVVTMKHAGYDLDVWHYSDFGVPRSYGLVIAANADLVNEDPELYEGFLRACRKGFDDMAGDKDAAMKVIMEQMNSDDNPLDEKQQSESYDTLLPLMVEESGFLAVSEERWQKVIDWMAEHELIDESFPASEVVKDRSY